MKLLARLSAAILFGLMFAPAASAQADWQGTYQFDEDGGKNAGGSVIFVTHELTVFETDGVLAATIKSNGYQTARDLNCTAKVEGQKLLLYFESYGDDNMFETYKKGDLLFILERKTASGKSTILTNWGKFTPIVPKNEKSGKVYFARSETQRL